MTRLPIEEASELVNALMLRYGHDDDEARIITNHLIDAELRGLSYAGLSRAVSVAAKISSSPEGRLPLRIDRRSALSSVIDGGNQTGYVVGYRATELVRSTAIEYGMGVASCFNTWMTGMFSYYMEMLTRQGLVGLAFGSSDWRVAPHGSSEGRFGTNPLAFGFPTRGDPVIYDAAVSSTMVSDAVMHQRLGSELAPGSAFDAAGRPTTDPLSALEGAFSVWGGHRGSGLGIVVQLFGLLAGSAVRPIAHKDCSMVILAIKPDLLTDSESFFDRASDYAAAVREARVLPGHESVRMPYDRSLANRQLHLAQGSIEVADEVMLELRRLLQ